MAMPLHSAAKAVAIGHCTKRWRLTRLTAIMNVMSWLKVYGEMECSIDIGDSTITDLHCLGNSN